MIHLKSLVLENEKKIEKLDKNYYLESKKYSVCAALSALETTNELQKSFLKSEDNLSKGDYILRLYALLQGLFVSIDSLYALALSIAGSKNFININENKNLRELKYIRNDVVGHPANRVLNNDVLAYCILDDDSITKDEFSYSIYTNDSIDKKTVYINDLLEAYYKESNKFLDSIYRVSLSGRKLNELENAISKTLDVFYTDGDYMPYLEKFINEYNLQYDADNNHRISWRYNLILKLKAFECFDENQKDLIDYLIEIELNKIYALIFNLGYKLDVKKNVPMHIVALYRFLNKNKGLYPYLDNLNDTSKPLFLYALQRIKDVAKQRRNNSVIFYIDILIGFYKKNDYAFLYAFMLPLKEYKRK